MLDLSWQELFLIGVVALIVIGPKDMPQVMRAMAAFVRKARALSREFQNGMAEMMREAELDDLRRKVEEAGRVDLDKTVKDALDPTGSLRDDFDPTEFAEKLRRDVEEPVVRRPAAATPAAAANPAAATAAAAASPAEGGPAAGDAPATAPLAAEPRRPDPAGPPPRRGE